MRRIHERDVVLLLEVLNDLGVKGRGEEEETQRRKSEGEVEREGRRPYRQLPLIRISELDPVGGLERDR